MTKHIAFLIESSVRKDKAVVEEFYKGANSRWFDSVIQYLDAIKFPKDDTFVLSLTLQRIFKLNEVITSYPYDKKRVSSFIQSQFAHKIVDFIHSNYSKNIIVDLHVGKSITAKLIPLLKEQNISYRVFAEDLQLLKKEKHYKNLISQNEQLLQYKQLKGSKSNLLHLIHDHSISTANQIINLSAKEPILHYASTEIADLKRLLKKYNQQYKQSQTAKYEYMEFLKSLNVNDPDLSILESASYLPTFFQAKNKLAHLKNTNGKLVAKYQRYLIKQSYVEESEAKIRDKVRKIHLICIKSA